MTSKTFYVIATGPSINDVTDEEWEYLSDKETISFGRFPNAGIKTKYYYAHEGQEYDKQNIDLMKENGFTDTRLILTEIGAIKHARKLGFKNIIQAYRLSALFLPERKPWFTDEEHPPYSFKRTRAHSFDEPLFRFRGQLSAVINTALILGANEIRLMGVDLNCQHGFFEEDYHRWIKSPLAKEYYKFHDELLKEHLETGFRKRPESWINYNKDKIHTTSIPYKDNTRWGDKALRPMQDVIQWMDKEIRDEGMSGIFNTSKRSLLNGMIEYKSIME